MKKQWSLLIMFTVLISVPGYTQMPEKAEDISPLLYGETLPEAVLKALKKE